MVKLKLHDPVFNIPLDIFDIYEKKNVKIKTIFDILDRKDNNNLTKMKKFDTNKIKDGLNCIEYALKLYSSEKCSIIKNQLRQSILYLSGFEYVRPPCAYSKMINLHVLEPDLYQILNTSNHDFSDKNFKSLNEINMYFITYYIVNDNLDFFTYIDKMNLKINKKISDEIIKHKPLKIIKHGIAKKYLLNTIFIA